MILDNAAAVRHSRLMAGVSPLNRGGMRGDKIVRRNDDDGSRGPLGSAVPTTGRSRLRDEGSGGMEPQPS